MSSKAISGCGVVATVGCDPGDEAFDRMVDSLAHRGPDARGTWRSEGVRLGHRRLAIVGTDARGNQPMTRGHVTVACNGEIYNHPQLRRRLEEAGHVFSSDCDVESLVYAYIEWGDDFLRHVEGIYAFALHDAKRHELHVARDPIGVKPMVWCTLGEGHAFASEVKALLCHSGAPRQPEFDAIRADVLQGLLGDKRRTWFRGIDNLGPGTRMVLDARDGRLSRVVRDWSYPVRALMDDEQGVVEQLRRQLEGSVRMQTASDVGISTTCSGGIDSVAVTALAAAAQPDVPLDVFAIDYEEEGPESPGKEDLRHARMATSAIPNARLHVVPVSISGMLRPDVIDGLVAAFDGPVPFDIRTLAFERLYSTIRQHGHRVVLTGQGADEMWMGYYDDPIYAFWKWSPERLSTSALARQYLNRVPLGLKAWNPGFIDPVAVPLAALDTLLNSYDDVPIDDPINRLSRWVTRTHFQAILNMDDKIAMRHALEPRVPWASSSMAALAFQVPGWLKLDSSNPEARAKHLVRQAVKGLVPDAIVRRKKAPFPDPQSPYGPVLRQLLASAAGDMQRSPFMRELFSSDHLRDVATVEAPERFMYMTYLLWRFGVLYVD